MFSKKIEHSFFKNLQKGLFNYSATFDLDTNKNISISIKGKSSNDLDFASTEIKYIEDNFKKIISYATKQAFDAYEVMKDVVESGEYDLIEDGGELPNISVPEKVWEHMKLTDIIIEPKSKYQIRLGFQCPWDIEHDFGIYVTNREYQYSGVSV